jgi:hypothetical protein
MLWSQVNTNSSLGLSMPLDEVTSSHHHFNNLIITKWLSAITSNPLANLLTKDWAASSDPFPSNFTQQRPTETLRAC